MNSDFCSSSRNSSLPTNICTLDDLIAVLCEARNKVGGRVKVQVAHDIFDAQDETESNEIGDVMLFGSQSLLGKNNDSEIRVVLVL